MKLTFFFLAVILLNPTMSFAAPVALCTTTIKCGNSTATCSSTPDSFSDTSEEHAVCGITSAKYRSCTWNYVNTHTNKVEKQEKYICCNTSGDAISFSSKASALGICDSPGAIQ